MSVYFYYGNLKDATITEGDVSCSAQYPITNINILNKNVYTELDDNDSELSAVNHIIDIVKVDFTSATAVTSCAIDLDSLVIDLTASTYNIEEVDIKLYYSDDDATYTFFGLLKQYELLATTFNETITDIFTVTNTSESHRYWKIALDIQVGTSDTLVWDIAGKINNLYIGDYLTLPCPNLHTFGS